MAYNKPSNHILYHWAHFSNCLSIDEKGLLPTSSEGAYQRVWLCSREQVMPVLAHLAQSKSVPMEDFRIYLVKADGLPLGKTSVPGRFWTTEAIPASKVLRSLAWPVCLTYTSEVRRHACDRYSESHREEIAEQRRKRRAKRGRIRRPHTVFRPPNARPDNEEE